MKLLFQDSLSDIDYIKLLYDYFCKNILNKIMYNNQNINIKVYPKIKIPTIGIEVESNFWHLISDNSTNSKLELDRIIDKDRCEKIVYIDYILNNEDVLYKCFIWNNTRSHKDKGISNRICICYDWNYLIVLETRKTEIVFWTAYPLSREHTIKKLQKEYGEYSKSNQVFDEKLDEIPDHAHNQTLNII